MAEIENNHATARGSPQPQIGSAELSRFDWALAQEPVKSTLRILSLDNGGMRTLLSLYMLDTFLSKYRRANNNPATKIKDIFNIIVGSGVASFCALALARGAEPSDAISALKNAGKTLVSTPASWFRRIWADGWYNEDDFCSQFQDLLKKFPKEEASHCKAAIPVTEKTGKKQIWIAEFELPREFFIPLDVVAEADIPRALLASTAESAHFFAQSIKLNDGSQLELHGIHSQSINPAQNIYNFVTHRKKFCTVVSFGCGGASEEETKRANDVNAAAVLGSTVFERLHMIASQTHVQLLTLCNGRSSASEYFRFDPYEIDGVRPAQTSYLANSDEMFSLVEKCARNYMTRDQEATERLRSLIGHLSETAKDDNWNEPVVAE